MCGILLFDGPGEPDPTLYNELGRYAGRRGPHGHGWWTAQGGLHRAPGPLLEVPADVYGGIIGHSRLSTMGDAGIEGVQPVLTNGADVMVHNGNVYNWQDLDATAASDSFALGAVYSQNRDAGLAPFDALKAVLAQSTYEATALAVLDRDGTILAYRRKLPLFHLFHQTGFYLSSGPLLGATELPAETVLIVEHRGQAIDVEVRNLQWELQTR